MTRLRKMMLEELQRRNFSPTTIKGYLRSVEAFAQHFGRPPDQLGLDEIRSYQWQGCPPTDSRPQRSPPAFSGLRTI